MFKTRLLRFARKGYNSRVITAWLADRLEKFQNDATHDDEFKLTSLAVFSAQLFSYLVAVST